MACPIASLPVLKVEVANVHVQESC